MSVSKDSQTLEFNVRKLEGVEVVEDEKERKSRRSEEHPRRIILHINICNHPMSMRFLANTCVDDSDQTSQMPTDKAWYKAFMK